MRSLLLLALLLLASGCLAGPAHPDPSATSPTATPSTPGTLSASAPSSVPLPWHSVRYHNGTVQAGVNAPPVSATPEMTSLGFEVQNATAVVIELAWDSPFGLDLCVTRPTTAPLLMFGGCEDPTFQPTVMPMPGAHRVTVIYTDPVQGKWSCHPTATTAAAQVPYRMAVTVFHGGSPPEGFTAL